VGNLRNEFAYSSSKARTLAECPRALWYGTYCSWGGWEDSAATRTRAAYVAKHMETWKMWAGSIVHDVASRMLKKSRAFPAWFASVSQGDFENWAMTAAQNAVGRGIAETKSKAYLNDPKGSAQIQDIIFNWKSFSEDKARDFIAGCIQALTDHGERWPGGRNLFRTAMEKPSDILSIERLDPVQYHGVTVWLAADLVMRGRDGMTVIVDWKTGQPKPADVSQAGVYAVLANSKGMGDTSGLLVYLAETPVKLKVVPAGTDEQMEVFSAEIDKFVSAMAPRLLEGDVNNNVPIESEFEVTKNTDTCRFCRFREICKSDGKRPV
jgi:CRISPR/Cas system-associated exonuclease Cas4 (RecB family)